MTMLLISIATLVYGVASYVTSRVVAYPEKPDAATWTIGVFWPAIWGIALPFVILSLIMGVLEGGGKSDSSKTPKP